MNVPMLKKETDEDGNVIKEEKFTLTKLEVIGRMVPDGLEIEVSIFIICQI